MKPTRERTRLRIAARDGQLVDMPPLVVVTFAMRGGEMIAMRNGKLLRLSVALAMIADEAGRIAAAKEAEEAAMALAFSQPGALL